MSADRVIQPKGEPQPVPNCVTPDPFAGLSPEAQAELADMRAYLQAKSRCEFAGNYEQWRGK